VFADSTSGTSAAAVNGGGDNDRSAGEIAGFVAIGVGVVAAVAVVAIIAWSRQQRKVETDQGEETAVSPVPIQNQRQNTVSDATPSDDITEAIEYK